MKKSDKQILDHLHEQTVPKMQTFQEYKTAYCIAMATIIHLESNYKDYAFQMKQEIYTQNNENETRSISDNK